MMCARVFVSCSQDKKNKRYAIMETITRAAQKLVVKDVSEYVARRIAATKEVVTPR